MAITEALGLADHGIEVIFLCGIGPLDERMTHHSNITVLQGDGFDVLTEANRYKAAIKGSWNIQAAQNLNKILSSSDTQDTLVHLHGWHRSLSSSISAAIQKTTLPFICTVHDYFLACPNGGFYNFQNNQPCPLRALSFSCLVEHCDPRVYPHKLWRYARTAIQKHLAKLPNAKMTFITVSEFSEKIIRPYLPQGALTINLPNPISVQKKPRVQIAENQHYYYAGRFMIDKGPMLLAEANRDRKFQLTFIGEGPLEDQLRSADPTAEFTGWLTRESYFEELSRARALIFTTRGYETQGMTVLEAASMGIPAIVSDSSAATAWVKDGVNGLWFRQGDSNDLREKIIALEDDALLSRLGDATYEQFWENPPTTDSHIEKLISIYKKVLSRGN